MIENRYGIIKNPNNRLEKFDELLSEFYSTNNNEKLKQFIYESYVDAIVFD